MSSQQLLFDIEPESAVAPKCDVIIYTDGACVPNPGPGGWAAVCLCNGKKKEIYGRVENTTNNRMELRAIIEGLKLLKVPCSVAVYTDSMYAAKPFQIGTYYAWKRRWGFGDGMGMPNEDLWKELVPLIEKHVVQFIWVKGHNGNIHNEWCDILANESALGKRREIG